MVPSELKSAVSAAASALIDEWISSSGQMEPPFPVEQIAHLVGVREIARQDLEAVSAVLLRMGRNSVINVNALHHPFKQNFSIGHEIGHILLDSLTKSNALPIEMRQGPMPELKERLCDIAAAELLMPRQIYAKYVSDYGLSVDAIPRLSKKFSVSVQAAARRITEVSGETCVMSYWKLAQPPPLRQEKPFAIWSVQNGEFLPRNPATGSRPASAPRTSSIFKAFVSDTSQKSFEKIALGPFKGCFYIESKRFQWRTERYVISLLFPERTKTSASKGIRGRQ